jgi:uncharacterized membrane protein
MAHIPLAGLLIAAGIAHLVVPEFFLPIMPSVLPFHDELVALSGLAELLAGTMLCVPYTRREGALLAVIVLIAIWPANWHHALAGGVTSPHLPPWMADARIAWCRLPLQVPLVWWAATFMRSRGLAAAQPSGSVLGLPVGSQPH